MALPHDKVNALKNKVADAVKKVVVDQYRDLRRHEVDKDQARDIATHGTSRGAFDADTDIGAGKGEP